MLHERMVLHDAYLRALRDHGEDSLWTRDGRQTVTLRDWWDSTDSSAARSDRRYIYTGPDIVRQGEDIQDRKTVIRRAAAKCSNCDVYVALSPSEFANWQFRRNRGEDEPPHYCVGCIAPGLRNLFS